MTLASETTARYSSTRLKQLTNPGDQNPSAIDATVLGLAATDVESDFTTYAGVAYDGSVARHVRVGVEGVIALLYLRGESPGSDAQKRHDNYIDRLRELAKVEGRDRLKPKTKEMAKITRPTSRTEPDFDDNDFSQIVPNAPTGTEPLT
jgi:hypothetical protein